MKPCNKYIAPARWTGVGGTEALLAIDTAIVALKKDILEPFKDIPFTIYYSPPEEVLTEGCGIDLGKEAWESIVRNNDWYNSEERHPGISSMELPELDNLEKADTFVKTQSEKVQAYLYKALYLNDMRIDKAETIISKDKK